MICRTQFLSRQLIGSIRFQSKFRAVIATEAGAGCKEETSSKCIQSFPWRERPEDAISTTWMKKFTFNCMKSYLLNIWGNSSSCMISEKELLYGVESAFAACINGVFQHNLVTNLCVEPHGLIPKLDKENVPILSDFMDTKLAQFYENAVLKSSISRQDIGYMLLAAEPPVIVDREFVIGSYRGQQYSRNPVAVASPYFGITFVLDTTSKEGQEAFIQKSFSAGYVTVRYWVDITCEEIFFVKDKLSDGLLQGSMEPQRITHQLLIESSCELNAKDDNWSVVDIDHWMGGNQFWAEDKRM